MLCEGLMQQARDEHISQTIYYCLVGTPDSMGNTGHNRDTQEEHK